MAAFAEGVPCWVDAQLPDVEAGKRFYGELFGWTFEGRARATATTRRPSATANRRRPHAQAGRPDAHRLDASTSPPRTPTAPPRGSARPAARSIIAPDAGRRAADVMALAADPGGAVFGALAGRQPPRLRAARHEPGTFGWTELVRAGHRAAVDAFYGAVFQGAHRAEQTGDGPHLDYRCGRRRGARRARHASAAAPIWVTASGDSPRTSSSTSRWRTATTPSRTVHAARRPGADDALRHAVRAVAVVTDDQGASSRSSTPRRQDSAAGTLTVPRAWRAARRYARWRT